MIFNALHEVSLPMLLYHDTFDGEAKVKVKKITKGVRGFSMRNKKVRVLILSMTMTTKQCAHIIVCVDLCHGYMQYVRFSL